MKWFANLKISIKLLLGFAVVMAVAVAVGVVGILNVQSINVNSEQMYANVTVPLGQLTQIATSFQQVRVNLREMILLSGAEKIAETEDKIAQHMDEINQQADEFSKTILSQEIKDAYQAFVQTREDFKTYMDQVIELAKQNKDGPAFQMLESDACYAAEQAEQNAILNLVTLKQNGGSERAQENAAMGDTAKKTVLIVLILGIALAAFLAWYIARLVSTSMKRIMSAAERISEGDLCQDIDTGTKDEIGNLALAFRKMTGNLNEVLSGVHAASEQVSTGAKQLSDSSLSLSQGASEQASSIEELTSSLEEISSQTKLNAQNASRADKLAGVAQGNAEQGNGQMREMLKSMEDINQSSASISKIIKVIDDIAFQTNILALNAAVEAARAGQHGKGFAVVAEEVRNLAAKSASAAKETTDMIESSIAKVSAGTKLAEHTAEALNKIVDGVAQAAALVKQIDVASNEQAIGLAQINQAVMQVSQVVQANSAVSEQSAAASKELASQAEMMRVSVSRFKLMGGVDATRPLASETPEAFSAKTEAPLPSKAREARPARPTGKTAITLSDEEFGKY